MIARRICWLVVMAGVAFLAPSEIGARRAPAILQKRGAPPAITIVDQNGRRVPNTPPSATSQIFDVTVGPGGVQVFSPATLNISVGDTVRWTWGSGGHSVTSGGSCAADSQFCSPDDMNCPAGILSGSGTVYQHTFSQAGTYTYFCVAHCSRGMVGSINVTASCTPPPANMIAWWPGDGNPHDIQNGNNGTLQGGATYTAGKVSQAFSFDGIDDLVDVPDAATLHLQIFTIDAWVNPTDLTQDRAIVIKAASSTGGNDFAYGLRVLSGGQAEGRITDAAGASASVVSTSVLSTSLFQHIALTCDGAALKLYVNGVLSGTTATTLIPVVNARPVSIGAWQSVSAGVIQHWVGLIDEVELFNRALTLTEIQGIYNAGSAGKCRTCTTPPANMVSWWPGDSNALDIQGGHNGSLEGGATFAPGKVGQAFSFNGTSAYVSVLDNANLYPSGSFTVDAWIKTSQTTGTQQIINHYECANFCPGGGANSDYEMSVIDGKLSGFIRDTTGASQALTGTTAIANGTFHFVAMQRDIAGGEMRLYLDGALETSATLVPTGVLQNDDGEPDPVTIGAVIQNNNPGCGCPLQLFSGLIDEVEYFSRALTVAEIAAIADAGDAGKCKSTPTPTPHTHTRHPPHRHPHPHHANTNTSVDHYLWHDLLLHESSPGPSAKCAAHPNWQYVRLNIVRWLR